MSINSSIICSTSMRKSIFFTTHLPRSNSISTAHFATKLGRQGCRRKTKLAAQMTAWITIILIIITLLAILYAIFKKCRYVSSLPRVCFPLYPFSTILRGTARTDIFVEIVNLASAEAMWAHFASVAVHPSQLRITGYPRAYDMHINKTLLLPTVTGRLAEYNFVRFGPKHN